MQYSREKKNTFQKLSLQEEDEDEDEEAKKKIRNKAGR
jgi:hypothetical protein